MTPLQEGRPRKPSIAASLCSSHVGTEFGHIVRFLLVGVLNTAVGLGATYASKYFFSIRDVPANGIGYLVGLTNSFFWNRRWTFSHSGDTVWTAARFVLVFAVAYSANLMLMLSLISRLRLNSYAAQALATIPYTVLFYLGSRYFVFVRRPVI
jgi:putative flippase GtrA